MQFFVVKGPQFWGDYGSILIGGMTGHLPRKDGMLQLERTGPFVPPLGISGNDLVVTAETRRHLEQSGLGDFDFVPVIKAKVVELHWGQFDRSQPLPDNAFPGDPEYIVLSRPHSPEIAEQLGELYEVKLPVGCVVTADIDSTRKPWCIYKVSESSWTSGDLIGGKRPNATAIVVTERGKQWLEEHYGEWVQCIPAVTTQ